MIDPHEISRKERYGTLYNWFAVSNVIFPPVGWRLPSYIDFLELRTYLSNNAQLIKSKYFWNSNPGTDDFYFTGMPGGYRSIHGHFTGYTYYLDLVGSDAFLYIIFSSNNIPIQYYGGLEDPARMEGRNVRLIKNDSIQPASNSLLDADGNVYRVVKIGNQVWTAQHWNCTRFSQFPFTPIDIIENPAWWGETGIDPRRCYINNHKTLS